MADSNDFSVLVLSSDIAVDALPFLSREDKEIDSKTAEEQENRHDYPSYFDEDLSDLELLQFIQVRGFDKHGSRIFQIVGKYFPEPYCILYMHTTVQKEDNSPGMTILRWIYEDLPTEVNERLQTVYFLHPGLRSRLAFATPGFTSKKRQISGNLYWKIKYVSRLQYLWDDIKKGEIGIPKFIQKHDDVLEHRPLTDYGIEPDLLPLAGVSPPSYVFGRHEDRWTARECIS